MVLEIDYKIQNLTSLEFSKFETEKKKDELPLSFRIFIFIFFFFLKFDYFKNILNNFIYKSFLNDLYSLNFYVSSLKNYSRGKLIADYNFILEVLPFFEEMEIDLKNSDSNLLQEKNIQLFSQIILKLNGIEARLDLELDDSLKEQYDHTNSLIQNKNYSEFILWTQKNL